VTAAAAGAPRTAQRRQRLGARARWLAGASVAYNAVEAVVAILAGAAASSIALIGFGLDSVVEMASGLVIVWQFSRPMPESQERRALRLIGGSFLALAAYVAVESLRALATASPAEASPVGIGLAAVSLVVMPVLATAKRRTGRALGSASVAADSTQTWLCTYLSAALLGGLVLNATLGWWWADPVVGLLIAAVAAREGVAAWRGEACDCTPAAGSGAGAGEATACEPGSGCPDDACTPGEPRAGSGGVP
jgi:divalent metal cation (Fe/Co/Zn/Cd) transporter